MSSVVIPKVPVTMLDGINAFDLPSWSRVVAGYVDGLYRWSAVEWMRWQKVVRVPITVTGNIHAVVADVERGDLSPQEARNWVETRQAHHEGPCTLYGNLETFGGSGGIWETCKGLAYYTWIADWDGKPDSVSRSAAHQYENTPEYDLSAVTSQEWLDAVQRFNDSYWPWS